MKTELLKILRETGDYISGQQLCEHFECPGLRYGKSSGS